MQDATRSLRCLTILGKLTGWDLLIQLWPIMLAMARLVFRFRRGPVCPEATFAFETELQTLLREMGRRIVQWTVNHLEPEDRDEMPSQFVWEGEYYRRRDKSPMRNLNCLFGPLRLRRFCYQPLETCGRCLFPLQLQLGIVAGVATTAVNISPQAISAGCHLGQRIRSRSRQTLAGLESVDGAAKVWRLRLPTNVRHACRGARGGTRALPTSV